MRNSFAGLAIAVAAGLWGCGDAAPAGVDAGPDPGPSVIGLEIEPASVELFLDSTEQLTVIASFDDGTEGTVTEGLSFVVAPASVATVSSDGVLTAAEVGSATVEVTALGKSASASVVVGDPTEIVALTAHPAAIDLQTATPTDVGLGATVTFADGSTMDVTGEVTWTPADDQQLVVDDDGIVLGLAPGETTLTASLEGFDADIEVFLFGPSLESFAFDLSSYAFQRIEGYTVPFRIDGVFSDGTVVDLTALATVEPDGGEVVVSAPGTLTLASIPADDPATLVLEGGLGGVTDTATATVATKRLFVASTQGNTIQAFALAPPPDGDIAPLQHLAGPSTGLSTPEGVFFDPVHDELWVGSQTSDALHVFSAARTATGDVAPVRSLTLPTYPRDVAYDARRDILYVSVSNGADSRVAVFDDARAIDSGTPVPSRVITGLGTTVYGLALDAANDRAFVVSSANSEIYAIDGASTADGDLADVEHRTFAAGIPVARSVALDAERQRLYAISDDCSISVYADADTADAPAERTAVATIAAPAAPRDCDGIAYDPDTDELYVASGGSDINAVFTFVGASEIEGAVELTPARTLSGAATNFGGPGGLAIGF